MAQQRWDVGSAFVVVVAASVACGTSRSSPTTASKESGTSPASTVPAWKPVASASASRSEGSPCPDPRLSWRGGTTYYVCDCLDAASAKCRPGNDAHPGTAPSAPWRTYEKARQQFERLNAGDTIAFCRGGHLRMEEGTRNSHVNPRCRAGNPCVVRDYLPPGLPNKAPPPIIEVAREGTAINLSDAARANHEEGYVFMNLDLRGSGAGVGFFAANDVDDVLICNVSIQGFAIGVHVAGSQPPEPGSDGLNQRIALRASRILNNKTQGWLGGCDDCVIDSNYFENNGFGNAVFDHNLYIDSGGGGWVRNMRVTRNELYRSTQIDGACQGVSLVVHGRHEGLLIENNLVREDKALGGCSGISVDTGYVHKPEGFRNVTIRGNRIINLGNTSIGLNACQDCTIENNVVIRTGANRDTVRGISVPTRSRGRDDLPMGKVTIRNNSILLGSSVPAVGIRLGGDGRDYVLVSNAVQYTGDHQRWSCFELGPNPAAYAAIDHNLCYFPRAPRGEWAEGQGVLAKWRQKYAQFDAHSLVEDPGFARASSPPFEIAPSKSSPLVDAGHPKLSAPKAWGSAPRDSKPDIGAHEAEAGAKRP